jgi:hypothetical protein
VGFRNGITDCGFDFGALNVTQLGERDGYATIWVTTEHCSVIITATPKGQTIHIQGETTTTTGKIKAEFSRGER